jgi:DNA adenine methylase
MSRFNCEKCGLKFSKITLYKNHECAHANDNDNDDNRIKLVKELLLNTKKVNISKPILKWVGGKTQILDKIIGEFPIEIKNYHEIFLGGSSVLLAVLSYAREGIIIIKGNIYAYDVNEALIYVYKNIQQDYKKLYSTLKSLIDEFNNCGDEEVNRKPTDLSEAKKNKENYYYWIRDSYNKCLDKKTIEASAYFIFLNKTCFRGVFRVGPNGFNVPYGNYNNPEIVNEAHLKEINELIKPVVFECCDFGVSIENVESYDYVYLDPPYAPENNTSFVGYTKTGFDLDNHKRLFKLIHELTEKNVKLMMSNSDVDLIRENFTNKSYNIGEILCKRSINSKNPEAKAKEVIIKNY